ncbi:hypothetical protein [Planktotalea sp.]|uniref:hypothetical protein n=1 Tax=Planktotalea sp. TaxID=2029877 RepID=UPI00329A7B77
MSETLYSETIQTARREKLESFLQFVETERADIQSQRVEEQPVEVAAPDTLATVIASDQTHHFSGAWKHFAMLLTFGGAIGQKM